MHVFLTLEGSALIVVCVHNLSSKLLCHALTAALTCEQDKVLHRNAFLALGTYLSRNLESCATYTTALHLYLRSDVVESLLPYLQSRLFFLCHLLLHYIKCIVKNLV